MKILIENTENSEPEFLVACIKRAYLMNTGHTQQCTIYCETRRSDGWMEHLMVYKYDDGGTLTVGAIQRTPGAGMEFHS